MSTSNPRPGRDWYKDTPPEDLAYPVATPAQGDGRTRYPAAPVLGKNLGIADEVAEIREVPGKATVDVVEPKPRKTKKESE